MIPSHRSLRLSKCVPWLKFGVVRVIDVIIDANEKALEIDYLSTLAKHSTMKDRCLITKISL